MAAKGAGSTFRLMVPAGKATPQPPVGSALGQRGLKLMDFCKAFNDQTASFKEGQEVRLVLTPERTLLYYAEGTEILRQTLIPDGWVFAVGGCGLTKFEILDDDAQIASTAA